MVVSAKSYVQNLPAKTCSSGSGRDANFAKPSARLRSFFRAQGRSYKYLAWTCLVSPNECVLCVADAALLWRPDLRDFLMTAVAATPFRAVGALARYLLCALCGLIAITTHATAGQPGTLDPFWANGSALQV